MLALLGHTNAQVLGEKPQANKTTRILFIFDASQSMYAKWQSDRKITIAQKLLSNLLDSIKNVPFLEIGLRVYGHQKDFPPQDCDDSKLEVPIGLNNTTKIRHVLKALIPRGTTPIARSLELAADDFNACDNCRNIIILITDGLEECQGDPCAVSKMLQQKGIILKPFIIGIGKDFKAAFDCVGTYFDASKEADFTKALNVVISQALNSTTAQVNLLDEDNNPTETNVNMTFFDNYSGLIKYNFIHTFNGKGLPDTLSIDPLLKYDIVVHTIPPTGVKNVSLTPGKHTIIPVSCPQGYLKLGVLGGGLKNVKDIQCIVRQKDKMETINVQTFDQIEKYITGKYDLEILSLPRLKINDVDIKQSFTTTVEIPMPGIAVIQKTINGYGGLFLEKDNKLELIYNLRENEQQESLILLPGNYRVVFRAKFVNKSLYTIEKKFKVESGATVRINLYQ